MKYWLCVTNKDNWKIIQKKKIWGVPKNKKGIMSRVKIGDDLIFYVKPKKIGGVLKAASESFESEKKIFRPITDESIFTNRITLKEVLVPKNPINVRKLVPKLSFIKNKEKWGWYLRGTMRLIPKEDYEIIKSALRGRR